MAFSVTAVAIVGAVVITARPGSWRDALYQAHLYYLARVPPLMWPRDTFTPAGWAQTPVAERYRLTKSLLADAGLKGRTRSEIAALLGDDVPRDATQTLYPLRRVGFQNLWWAMVVEFDHEHVVAARRDMAWLDP
jgi:hypothetical protein